MDRTRQIHRVLGRNKDDPETQRIFRSAQQEAAQAKLRFDGREIEIEAENDKGDSREAYKKAGEIVADPRTLAVIGHVNGDITKDVLPVYMTSSPMVPVITTRETTPRLLENIPFSKEGNNYCPLLPLSPNDDIQASDMVEFALKKSKRRCVILQEDEQFHRTYTNYLTNEIDALLQQKGTNVARYFVSTEVSFSTTLGTISQQKPDYIFYVGGAQTLRNYDAYLDKQLIKDADRPIIIASDAALTGSFLEKPMPMVYFTHQLSASEYRQSNHIFGTDAIAIVSQLISEVGETPDFRNLGFFPYLRYLVNMHRARDARELLIKQMKQNADNSTLYTTYEKRRYHYIAKYKRAEGRFHIWRVDKNKIDEADGLDGEILIATRQSGP